MTRCPHIVWYTVGLGHVRQAGSECRRQKFDKCNNRYEASLCHFHKGRAFHNNVVSRTAIINGHVDLVFQPLHYFDSMGSSLQDSCNSGTPHPPTWLTFLEMPPYCMIKTTSCKQYVATWMALLGTPRTLCSVGNTSQKKLLNWTLDMRWALCCYKTSIASMLAAGITVEMSNSNKRSKGV